MNTSWADELPLHPTLAEVVAADVHQVHVRVPMGDEDVRWTMNAVQRDVLLGQLRSQPLLSHPHDALFAKLGNPLPVYTGVQVNFETYDGAEVPGLVLFGGRVVTERGMSVVRPDAGREMEFWVWGTAQTRRQQLLAVQALPVFTFAQCVALGNLVIETTPRQCLLPDNNLLLESPETVTVADLAITDFDSCLQEGRAIIDAFPRRCMARGGRVFTEPPRLIEVEDTDAEVDLDAFIEEVRGDNMLEGEEGSPIVE